MNRFTIGALMASGAMSAAARMGTASAVPLAPPHAGVRDDSASIVALERRWLAAEHDSATLAGILAPDFVHVVPTGDFLTKAQHIHYASLYRPAAGDRFQFDTLAVRLYGDVAIANGIVRATHADGTVERTIFTDVFARRNGEWRAVNAQENAIAPRRRDHAG